jgi:hypothetical protein
MVVSMLIVTGQLLLTQCNVDFGMKVYSDSGCKTAAADDGSGLVDYRMAQFGDNKFCYFHNGYSIELSCGSPDTVTVDHWLDATGKEAPCRGDKMNGAPLMEDVPWDIALDFFNGECVWSEEHGTYVKLSAPLPSDGFPKCDFTGAIVRRLENDTAPTPAPNGTAPTPAPPASANVDSCRAPTAFAASFLALCATLVGNFGL